jgi:26S proteasome regulatory subunit N3
MSSVVCNSRIEIDILRETVIVNNLSLVVQAVDNFDSRFTLRALRSIYTLRKSDRFAEAIVHGIRTAYPKASNRGRQILEDQLPSKAVKQAPASATKEKDGQEEQTLPEIWSYLGVLIQVG